eukprot:COSAG02_NODE_43059_length_378_cov_1.197133_1_plen_46_part_10
MGRWRGRGASLDDDDADVAAAVGGREGGRGMAGRAISRRRGCSMGA